MGYEQNSKNIDFEQKVAKNHYFSQLLEHF
jgi:hypothetical protein